MLNRLWSSIQGGGMVGLSIVVIVVEELSL